MKFIGWISIIAFLLFTIGFTEWYVMTDTIPAEMGKRNTRVIKSFYREFVVRKESAAPSKP